jgi:alanyl-tRNA synthetase
LRPLSRLLADLAAGAHEEKKEEWPVTRVRETFVDFFASKHAHSRFPSSPVVPYEDPTLLFANAGMNQVRTIYVLVLVLVIKDSFKFDRAAWCYS